MILARILSLLFAASIYPVQANVEAVFAHFIVSNTGLYGVPDWESEITTAQAAKIDAFALNIAVNDSTNGATLGYAFKAAENLGSSFKLFFSFDYAANGLWEANDVISLLKTYSSSPAYFHRGNQPFVSTFEGPAAAADWTDIKSATGCFVVPSWSSVSSVAAWNHGTADGLFSWAAWPEGPNNMNTFTDSSYLDVLGGSPFMMGVSPWFYTNLPGYKKNWLWRGDTLWFDRWVNVLYLQPTYVEIITWNDYGESHYIGPLRENAYVAFSVGQAPFNYVLNMPHDGWRNFLPYLIDLAKTNSTSFSKEDLVAWHRPNPSNACGTGGTTGNTASQLQDVYSPGLLAADEVFFTALLASSATVTVTIGGVSVPASWTTAPSGGVGLYRGSVPFSGQTGAVVVSITRSGTHILQASGGIITSDCTDSIENWNAIVTSGAGNSIAATSWSIAGYGCIEGVADNTKYLNLCSFGCKYDYCPRGACTCTAMGPVKTPPTATGSNGCPAAGADSTFLGLCSFGCNRGYCPDACTVYPAGHVCVAPDPTAPPVPVCVSGYTTGAYADLCSFSCSYGFCPPQVCTCTQAGTSSPTAPPDTGMIGNPVGPDDFGMCAWTCLHGKCPTDVCHCSGSGCPTTPTIGAVFSEQTELQVTRNVAGQVGQTCSIEAFCTDQTDLALSACPKGQVKIGWDKARCSNKNFGLSICCGIDTSLTLDGCQWRGSGSNCNGQCQAGEQVLATSLYGGTPSSGNQKKCTKGWKSLCCKDPDYTLDTKGCRWSGCTGSCKSSETIVTQQYAAGLCSYPTSEYCCPDPSNVYDCQWRGTAPDCYDNECAVDEVLFSTSAFGNGYSDRCQYRRKQSLCCKISAPPPPAPLSCASPNWCSSNKKDCAAAEANDLLPSKRGLGYLDSYEDLEFYSDDLSIEDDSEGNETLWERSDLSKRAKPGLRPLPLNSYPPVVAYSVKVINKGKKLIAYTVSDLCRETSIIRTTLNSVLNPYSGLQTEHIVDKQILTIFLRSCSTNVLPNGGISKYDPIPLSYLNGKFRKYGTLPTGLPKISDDSPDITSPMARVIEAIGSNTNLDPFVLLQAQMNRIKGAIAVGENFLTLENFEKAAKATFMKGADHEDWFPYLQQAIAVFTYLQDPIVAGKFIATLANVGQQFKHIQDNIPDAAHIYEKWEEFVPIYFQHSSAAAQAWAVEACIIAENLATTVHPTNYAQYVLDIQNLYSQIADMEWPDAGY